MQHLERVLVFINEICKNRFAECPIPYTYIDLYKTQPHNAVFTITSNH
jgi:hypothetical protein